MDFIYAWFFATSSNVPPDLLRLLIFAAISHASVSTSLNSSELSIVANNDSVTAPVEYTIGGVDVSDVAFPYSVI